MPVLDAIVVGAGHKVLAADAARGWDRGVRGNREALTPRPARGLHKH